MHENGFELSELDSKYLLHEHVQSRVFARNFLVVDAKAHAADASLCQ